MGAYSREELRWLFLALVGTVFVTVVGIVGAQWDSKHERDKEELERQIRVLQVSLDSVRECQIRGEFETKVTMSGYREEARNLRALVLSSEKYQTQLYGGIYNVRERLDIVENNLTQILAADGKDTRVGMLDGGGSGLMSKRLSPRSPALSAVVGVTFGALPTPPPPEPRAPGGGSWMR